MDGMEGEIEQRRRKTTGAARLNSRWALVPTITGPVYPAPRVHQSKRRKRFRNKVSCAAPHSAADQAGAALNWQRGRLASGLTRRPGSCGKEHGLQLW